MIDVKRSKSALGNLIQEGILANEWPRATVGGAMWLAREVHAHHQHSQLILPLRGAKKVLER